MFTKSGLMVGLGEARDEVMQVMDDLRVADVDFLTIGQYLQPTLKHAAVAEFVTPEEFARLCAAGARQGVPDGLGHAADAQFLPRRCGFRRAAGGAGGAARRPRLAHADACRSEALPYRAEQLFDLVADVGRYPEFLPWCAGARVVSRSETELVAILTIGFGPFRESFTSRVALERPAADPRAL